MRRWIVLPALLPLVASAQIFRCETPEGPVFSDRLCGEAAEVVQLRADTAGLGGGASEEVRAYLAQKRDERAAERETAQDRDSQAPAPAPQVIEQPVMYWPMMHRPDRPHDRPRPERPRPEHPIEDNRSTLRPQPRGG